MKATLALNWLKELGDCSFNQKILIPRIKIGALALFCNSLTQLTPMHPFMCSRGRGRVHWEQIGLICKGAAFISLLLNSAVFSIENTLFY